MRPLDSSFHGAFDSVAKSRKARKRFVGANALIVLFLLASLVSLSFGSFGLLHHTERFAYAFQNLAFGAVLAASAYALHRGARRGWWMMAVLYTLMAIAIGTYAWDGQGQVESAVKMALYLVILACLAAPGVRKGFLA